MTNFKYTHLSIIALLLLLLPMGCNSEKEKNDTDVSRDALLTQKGLFGQWEMIISQSQSELHPFLFNFEEQKNRPDPMIKMTDTIENFSSWVLDSSEVIDPVVTLNLAQEDSIVTFKGTKRERGIFGAIAFPDGRVFPARLERTTNVNLDSMNEAVAYPIYEEYKGLFAGKAAFDNLKGFIEKYPESALSLNASKEMIARSGLKKLSNEEIKKLIDEYIALATTWDRLLLPKVYTEVVQTLTNFEFPVSLIKSVVEETEEFPDGFFHKNYASNIQYDAGFAYLNSDDPKLQKEGSDIYMKMLEESPYSPDLLIALGQYEEKTGKSELALEHFAQLKILPGLEGITIRYTTEMGISLDLDDKIESLFKKVKPKGIESTTAYLDKTYHDAINGFHNADTEVKPATEKQRVVLCELFTGAACPPCVAADLATVAMEKELPKSHFITLRYHQHIPAPDPLANPVVESRFNFYPSQRGSKSTPTVMINGNFTPVPIAGGFPQTPGALSNLRDIVNAELSDETEIKINLDIKVDGNVISISGNVENLPKDKKNLKLRMALAEDVVIFDAPNGIREHEMLVREMPGGVKGISISSESNRFEEKVNVEQLRGLIKFALEQFEANTQNRFRDKPMELNKLHLVAFVQHDEPSSEKGLEILQAKAMQVPGEFKVGSTKEKKPEAKKSEDKKEKETPKVDASKMKKVEDKKEPTKKETVQPEKKEAKVETEKSNIPPAPKTPIKIEK